MKIACARSISQPAVVAGARGDRVYLRGDRQPEFTQLDLEMSFVTADDVMAFVETMAIEVSRAVVPERRIVNDPFPRMTYREAVGTFGRSGMRSGDSTASARTRPDWI